MNGMSCERLRELGAELALGVLPARERAQAEAHLDRCPGCREHVEQLTLAGDGLLGLIPAGEPPVGFETRVLDRLLSAAPPTRRRNRLRLAAAAAALAVACGFGGWAVGTAVDDSAGSGSQTQDGTPRPALLQAALVSGGQEVGRIFAYPGGPGWVYMSVDLDAAGAPGGGAGAGAVRCLLERSDGSTVAVGAFSLKDGYGSWGAPAPVDPSTLTGARVLAADGSVLATARFPAADRS
ncbi:hypothetical protein OG429_38320 [Streptomyces sp. NBC_00190]|uniref:zf-HC2 domain-containing protein n=1 Tax=unclassified Streptomyces TaxID=2593676 RepID=UPI002E2E12FE|nr:zf-HC2 domain-containing protein [Streptomyces sp. NBC_00190]WSZ44614.1 hypothetical protein OG239_40790 [Streptomyces sp. NBC_00868]